MMAGVGPAMGRVTAALFAQEGARLVLVARRAEQLDDTAHLAGGARTVVSDLTDPAAARRAVEEAVAHLGGLDVLYLGAGGFFAPGRELDDLDPDFVQAALANLTLPALNTVLAARPHLGRGGGSIIVIGASEGTRQRANAAYAAGKGAVGALVQRLARALWAENIRVNAILPGLIRLPLPEGPVRPAPADLTRMGAPSDVAYAALYLASDEAGWVSGAAITVDGGFDTGPHLPPPTVRRD